MFLSSEKSTSDPELDSLHHSSFLALTTVTPRSPPSCIYSGASATSTKCGCSTCAQPWPAVAHHSITPAVAMAVRQVPRHLQDRDADVPHSSLRTRPTSVVSRRPGCIQHGKLSTTSTQVVTNQSCSRETDTDAICQTRLLSLWSQYMEQSSSSSPQHW